MLALQKIQYTKTYWKFNNSTAKRQIQKGVFKVVLRIIDFTMTIIGSSKVFQIGESSNSIPNVNAR